MLSMVMITLLFHIASERHPQERDLQVVMEEMEGRPVHHAGVTLREKAGVSKELVPEEGLKAEWRQCRYIYFLDLCPCVT